MSGESRIAVIACAQHYEGLGDVLDRPRRQRSSRLTATDRAWRDADEVAGLRWKTADAIKTRARLDQGGDIHRQGG